MANGRRFVYRVSFRRAVRLLPRQVAFRPTLSSRVVIVECVTSNVTDLLPFGMMTKSGTPTFRE